MLSEEFHGRLFAIFFLPKHWAFFMPEVILTETVMFKVEYMEESLESPTET